MTRSIFKEALSTTHLAKLCCMARIFHYDKPIHLNQLLQQIEDYKPSWPIPD